jgi:exodeoxyribonuclease-5
MELTNCQSNAYQGIIEWSESSQLFCTLAGAAGTGKTTLLGAILKQIKQRNHCVVTAPTHQARQQIANKTGRPNATIQSILGLKPNVELDNFDPNKPEFITTGRELIASFRLIVIDECSMLNDDLYDFIIELAKRYNTKVLFVGDKYQLKPVGQNTLAKPFLYSTIYPIFELKEIVRQAADNPISILLTAIRNELACINNEDNYTELNNFYESVSNYPEYKDEIRLRDSSKTLSWVIDNIPVTSGYHITKDELQFARDTMEQYRSEDFNDDPYTVKVLAYTNGRVSDLNLTIRNRLMKANDVIVVGDLLVGYKTVIEDRDELLVNSRQYVVSNVVSKTLFDINCYKVTIDCIDDESFSEILIVKPEDYYKFVTFQQNAYRKYKMGDYLARMDNFQTIHNMADIYPDGVHVNIEGLDYKAMPKFLPRKTIDYAYALTVHKSQGSTYDQVFVDGKNLAKYSSRDRDNYLRLLYVACSRASEKTTVLI